MGKHTLLQGLKQKVNSFLKEAVKEPPKPVVEELTEEETLPPPSYLEEDFEAISEIKQDDAREEVLFTLNNATKQWKETGDIGIHLEAPVPFHEKAKAVWNKIAYDISPKLAAKLKEEIDYVAEKASAHLHRSPPLQPADTQPTQIRDTAINSHQSQHIQLKTPAVEHLTTPPEPPAAIMAEKTIEPKIIKNPGQAHPATEQIVESTATKTEEVERVIIEEWQAVLQKVGEQAQPSEREEIEKIYKQLSQ